MPKLLGIRREDKNMWERRVPLIPEHVKQLKDTNEIQTVLQPFERRAIGVDEFEQAGADYNEDLSECPVIIAVKEIPIDLLMHGKTYMFFSHTVKGQDYNMPLLQKLLDEKCTLIDYERIADDKGKRLVFFGRFAGVAGMIDALHGYGKRLKYLGYDNLFEQVKPAYEYNDIEDAKKHIKSIGEQISEAGLPNEAAPHVFGFTGYGNVSRGAQEIFDLLPHVEITPDELPEYSSTDNTKLVKVVFKEVHMVEPKSDSDQFDLQDYFKNADKYKSIFEKHIPYLSMVINCIYWDEHSPRFMTKDYFKSADERKLEVICDISCDINGAVEFTSHATDSDNPAYVFDPKTDSYTDGFEGNGIVVIAVDNLPTELPKDASQEFSNNLVKFIPGIIDADTSLSFAEVDYPPEIKRAVIVYKGELTPDYKYLQEFL